MSEWVIQTAGLTRYFGAKCAVDQVTLNVPRGSVFALLGRNGSGKSTLTRMLLGLLEPTRGSASVLGTDCRNLDVQTRGKIGYVAEGHPLIHWMRVRDLHSFQRSFIRAGTPPCSKPSSITSASAPTSASANSPAASEPASPSPSSSPAAPSSSSWTTPPSASTPSPAAHSSKP